MKTTQLCQLLLLSLLLVGVQISAQEDEAPAADPATEDLLIPADRLDRGTPMRSAEGFLRAVDAADYETAAEYLDLRNLRGEATDLTGAQLARRFSVIVGRATWVDVSSLVDDPEGRGGDGLPAYRDSLGFVVDGDNEVRLLLQKVPRGDGVSIWKISNATVTLIPKLYAIYGYPEYIEDLRRSLPGVTFLGYELFKWVAVLAVGFIAYVTVFFLALVIRRLVGDPNKPSHRRVFKFLALPFAIWVVIIAMNSAATLLGKGVTAETIERVSPIPILVTLWMMFGAINLLRDTYANRLHTSDRSGAAVLLRTASNAFKLLIATAAVLIYLDNLGINITTVLAGLGVGGLAVALALQKPMEDVFGAITLYTQQPIRVGDFCRIGDNTGTIEEIGLRTTLVRTLANTLIAIPNARLASEPIDNISARKKILYWPTLRLRYDSTPEQLQQVLEGIRSMFDEHEQVLQKGHRVRFKKIADDALLIEAYAYLNTRDWEVYMELVEDLNMRILKIIAESGTSLSLPARTLHIEQANGLGEAAIK